MNSFPIYAIWAHPRSLSSVIERVMMERGDLATFHEPFSYMYYVTEGHKINHLMPDPKRPSTYEEVVQAIHSVAAHGPVYIKDMSYYIVDRLADNEEFFGSFHNSFVIRHPARAIASYSKLQTDFSLLEVGLESQYWHLNWILERQPDWAPLVIDADQLQSNPGDIMRRYCDLLGLEFLEDSLTWEKGLPEQWTDWAKWHITVEASTGLEASTPKPLEASLEVVQSNPRFREYYEHHLPFYQKMLAYCIDVPENSD